MSDATKLSKVQVTILDTKSGDTVTQFVPEDSYIVVCAGRMYVAHKNMHQNGTVQLTLKLDDGVEDGGETLWPNIARCHVNPLVGGFEMSG